jgi:hypothetical protein
MGVVEIGLWWLGLSILGAVINYFFWEGAAPLKDNDLA